MKKLLLLLLFPALLCAQADPKPRHWAVKIDAPQLFDPFSFPVVQLSVERKITSAIAVIAEGGVQLYDSPDDYGWKPDTLIYRNRGFKADVELRFYVLQWIDRARYTSKFQRGVFAGIQPFYRQNRYTTAITYNKIIKPETPPETADEYGFEKDYFGVDNRSYGLNVTMGFQRAFMKRIVLEPSLAVGYLHRKVSNSGRTYNPNTDDSDNIHDIFGFERRRLSENSGPTVNFSIHFRIGYIF